MVRNNEIISADEIVVNVKELRNEMIVTEISNISEFDLENCLKIIFDSNKCVNFHTYQYSKYNQTIYLYSDRDLNLTEYKNFRANRPVAQTSEILKEIRNVLSKNKTKDLENVSLYDLFNVVTKHRKGYKRIKRLYNVGFDCIIKSRCGKDFSITIYDFDYVNNVLKLSFDTKTKFDTCTSEYMYFSKVDGKICLNSERTLNSDITLFLLGNHLSKLYDDFMSYKNFMTESVFNISSDSKFVINVTQNGIVIRTTALKNRFNYDFVFTVSSYNGECKCDCDSIGFLKLLDGKYKEFLERISVKIEDCPNNLKESLYELRNNEQNNKNFSDILREKSINLTKQIKTLIKK